MAPSSPASLPRTCESGFSFAARCKAALKANLRDASEAERTGDRSRFYAADVAFHAILTQQLGLDRSGEILDGVREHLERVRRLLMSPPGRMRKTIAEHAAVAEEIDAGDALRARAAMEAHMTAMTALFEDFSSQRPELFSA
jgi:DNA-binding FadR family transcriptional regulator